METNDEGWIVTYTGRQIYPLDARAEQIDIEDIAHALSNLCRFTGHVSRFYSVAQHSVVVTQLVIDRVGPGEVAAQALLHDATEAYLCDVARPLKSLPGFAAYRDAESALWEVIAQRYEVDPLMHPLVKEIDARIVTNEAYKLLATMPRGWHSEPGFTDMELSVSDAWSPFDPWEPRKAKTEFLKLWGGVWG